MPKDDLQGDLQGIDKDKDKDIESDNHDIENENEIPETDSETEELYNVFLEYNRDDFCVGNSNISTDADLYGAEFIMPDEVYPDESVYLDDDTPKMQVSEIADQIFAEIVQTAIPGIEISEVEASDTVISDNTESNSANTESNSAAENVPVCESVKDIPHPRASAVGYKFLLIPAAIFAAVIAVTLIFNFFDSVTAFGTKIVYTVQSVPYGIENGIFDEYKKSVSYTVTDVDGNISAKKSQPITAEQLVVSLYGTSEGYSASCPFDTVLSDGMDITIYTFSSGSYSATEAVPYGTHVVQVQTIPKGTRVIIQSGEDGIAERVYNTSYINSELKESVIAFEKIIKEPVEEIVCEGSGGSFTAANGRKYNYSYYIDVEATAYGVDTGYGGDGTHTSTGKPVASGIIAVDPDIIPLGTKVFVTGDYKELGVCYAEDTGSAILGYRIDVYLGSDLEAQLAFGRRDMRVYILE